MSEALPLVSNSPEDTRSLGERLGALLEPGDVILLSGELGAGKTLFVQGLARGLGFEGGVSSKSFVLLGEYPGRLTLYHADLYRLDNPDDIQDLALDEISADGVLAVEWPERAGDGLLPDDHLRIEFEVTSETVRQLRLVPRGTRAATLTSQMATGNA
jgi:tRNA threonylcarbamoyladenosine biosynthesis protein TsaE